MDEVKIKLSLRNDIPFAITEVLLDLLTYRGDYSWKQGIKSNCDARKKTVLDKFNRSSQFVKTPVTMKWLSKLTVRVFPKLNRSEVTAEHLKALNNDNGIDLGYYVLYKRITANTNEKFTDKVLTRVLDEYEFEYEFGITEVKEIMKLREYESLNAIISCSIATDADLDCFYSLINYFKKFLIPNHPLIIGEISDETGKEVYDIYLNKAIYQEILQGRAFICEGCEKFSMKRACPNFKYCKAAYERGKRKGEFKYKGINNIFKSHDMKVKND